MKPIPLVQYLSQLETEKRPQSVGRRTERRESPYAGPRLIATTTESELPASPSIEERIAEAYERGVQDGRIEANAETARRETARNAAHENRFQKERQEFLAGKYASLADAIAVGLTDIEDRIAEAVARILKPYVTEQQGKIVVEALCSDIEKLLATDEPALLRIQGPEKLLDAMRERLSGRPFKAEYRLSEDVDVIVEANNTRIETQLQSWIASIS